VVGQAGVREQVLGGVQSLGDPVGEQHQQVLGVEPPAVLAVGQAVHGGHHRAVALVEDVDRPRRPADHGRVVTRVAVDELAALQIEERQEHGHEHARVVPLCQLAVHLGQDGGRRGSRLGEALDQRLGHRGEQGGGDPLTRDVAHTHAEDAGVDEEEIVEVSADLAGGDELREQLAVVPLGELEREHAHLDLASDVQLALHALLGRAGPAQVLQRALQLLVARLERGHQRLAVLTRKDAAQLLQALGARRAKGAERDGGPLAVFDGLDRVEERLQELSLGPARTVEVEDQRQLTVEVGEAERKAPLAARRDDLAASLGERASQTTRQELVADQGRDDQQQLAPRLLDPGQAPEGDGAQEAHRGRLTARHVASSRSWA
jgi:hypothetical protein